MNENEIIISRLPIVDGEPEEWIAEYRGYCGHGASPYGARRNLESQIRANEE